MIEGTKQVLQFAQKMHEASWGDTHDDAYAPRVVAIYVRKINEALVEIATQCVEDGIQAGLTQKALADALGVPPSALRGAKQEFAS